MAHTHTTHTVLGATWRMAELERLKQQVIFNIRDNAEREREVNQLDIKIALLIKNRSSLEDVVETTKQYRKKMERASIVDPSNLKALDKETRDKLEVSCAIGRSGRQCAVRPCALAAAVGSDSPWFNARGRRTGTCS